MITNWNQHWDNLLDNRTKYGVSMFRNGMNSSLIKENVPTIFIKRDKASKKIEGVWEGTSSNFKKEDKWIHFKVNIEKEIEYTEYPKKYLDYSEGWYIEDINMNNSKLSNPFEPPVFSTILNTGNWGEFEDLTNKLLKIIGIPGVYKYEKQRSQPDGFFRFNKLAVIYDSTLEEDFISKKESQIRAYCSQLSKSEIRVKKNEIPLNNCTKQIWIITKGKKNELLLNVGDIAVKEITINSLIKLYNNRINEDWNAETFEKELENL